MTIAMEGPSLLDTDGLGVGEHEKLDVYAARGTGYPGEPFLSRAPAHQLRATVRAVAEAASHLWVYNPDPPLRGTLAAV